MRLTLQLARAQNQPEEAILELETVRDKNLLRQMAAACTGECGTVPLRRFLLVHYSLHEDSVSL